MVPINFVRSPSTANQDGFFAEGCKTARRGKIDNVDTTGTAQRPNPEQGEGGGEAGEGRKTWEDGPPFRTNGVKRLGAATPWPSAERRGASKD